MIGIRKTQRPAEPAAATRWQVTAAPAIAFACALVLHPLAASADAWSSALVSHNASGLAAGVVTDNLTVGSMTSPKITPDGRYVLFASRAADILAGVADPNGGSDVFVLDRQNGAIELISRSATSATTTPNNQSYPSAITPDGRFVLFNSLATDLVAGQIDSNANLDVFVFDRQTGSTELVSHSSVSPATTGSKGSTPMAMSADGRYVLLHSDASDLAPGVIDPANFSDVFVYDRQTATMELVSHSFTSPLVPANFVSFATALTPDGRYVLFMSVATDILAGVIDAPFTEDVFVLDRQTGLADLVSHRAGDSTTAARGAPTAITPDGRYVLFHSPSTDLVAGVTDVGGFEDVFVADRQTGTAELISRSSTSATTTPNNHSEPAAITPDGRLVLFRSQASDVAFGGTDVNGSRYDVFVFDRQTGQTDLISRSALVAGNTANLDSFPAAITPDGRAVLFYSTAWDLIAGSVDLNGVFDLFLYDRQASAMQLISHAASSATTTGNGALAFGPVPGLASNGLDATFSSAASDLVAGVTDTNGTHDAFVAHHEVAPLAPTIISLSPAASSWSNDNTVLATWSGAADEPFGSGLAGYSVLFDHAPAGSPDSTVEVPHTVDPHSTVSAALADGDDWYFHLRSCDQAGNCSSSVHGGPLMIDTTPPSAVSALSSPSHGDGLVHSDPTIDIVWSPAVDALSGVVAYRVTFDANPVSACPASGGSSATSATSPPLGTGTWYAHVCAVDAAGNVGPPTDGGPYRILGGVVSIPTLTPAGLAWLVLAMALAGGLALKRR